MRKLVLLACAVAAALWIVPAALAGEASFALRPVTFRPALPATQSYFIFDSRRGATIRSEVRVTNVGTVPGTALLYAVDATTGRTSGAVYRSGAARRRDVGRWVALSARRITLGPQESRIVSFRVVVPRRARAGEHLGGIVAQNLAVQTGPATKVGKKGGFRIRLRHLTIVAVEVTLPGRRIERVAVTGTRPGSEGGFPAVEIGLVNAGNVIVKPHLRLHITDENGKALLDRRVVLDSLVPETSISYPVILRRSLPTGSYRADVSLDYGRGVTTHVMRPMRVKGQTAQTYTSAAPPPSAASDDGNSSNGISNRIPWILAAAGFLAGLFGVGFALRARSRLARTRSRQA